MTKPRPFRFGVQAAASVTTMLRIGTLVLDNDFRHPAFAATEAAMLDVLSDGGDVRTSSCPAERDVTRRIPIGVLRVALR